MKKFNYCLSCYTAFDIEGVDFGFFINFDSFEDLMDLLRKLHIDRFSQEPVGEKDYSSQTYSIEGLTMKALEDFQFRVWFYTTSLEECADAVRKHLRLNKQTVPSPAYTTL